MLEIVKLYLGIKDTLQDELLEQIIKDTTASVQSYINEDYLPEQFQYVVREVAIVRYNRIGSEGISQETEEGRSATYGTDPLSPYHSTLDKYIESKTPVNVISKAKFL